MGLLNGKVGDKVRIINYGHIIWENKEEGNPKPDNVIYEDENSYYIDIRPDFIGKETIIIEVTEVQGRIQYSTKLFSWAKPTQLELL